MMKEEALKLADELQKHFNCYNEYSDMIRRLVEELDKQSKPVGIYDGKSLHIYTPQTKPLSDDEILDMSDDYIANQFELAFTGEGLVEYVKAVMKKAGQR